MLPAETNNHHHHLSSSSSSSSSTTSSSLVVASSSCWAIDIETLGHLPKFEGKGKKIPPITCACLYNGITEHALNFYHVTDTIMETNKATLIHVLDNAQVIIGFNAILFDLEYIKRFFSISSAQLTHWILKTVDPYIFMKTQLGMTCSLGALLAMNQLPSKSASGLKAIIWAKQGRMDLVLDYCMMDTKLTYALCCNKPSFCINDFWFATWKNTQPPTLNEDTGFKSHIQWSSERKTQPPTVCLHSTSSSSSPFISTEHLFAQGRVTCTMCSLFNESSI